MVGPRGLTEPLSVAETLATLVAGLVVTAGLGVAVAVAVGVGVAVGVAVGEPHGTVAIKSPNPTGLPTGLIVSITLLLLVSITETVLSR